MSEASTLFALIAGNLRQAASVSGEITRSPGTATGVSSSVAARRVVASGLLMHEESLSAFGPRVNAESLASTPHDWVRCADEGARITPNQFRKLALETPGAEESSHMSHRDLHIAAISSQRSNKKATSGFSS